MSVDDAVWVPKGDRGSYGFWYFVRPRRRETRDFIFRVKSWEARIDALDCDMPRLLAELEEYCAHQFMGKGQTNACMVLVEDLAYDHLVGAARAHGIENPDIGITVSGGEGGVDARLQIDYRRLYPVVGDIGQLADDITRKLLAAMVEDVSEDEPGLVTYAFRRSRT